MIDLNRLIEQLDDDETLTDAERREIYNEAKAQNQYEEEQEENERWNGLSNWK